MEKLDWGKRLVFANVREYYETLGFLCKEKDSCSYDFRLQKSYQHRVLQNRQHHLFCCCHLIFLIFYLMIFSSFLAV